MTFNTFLYPLCLSSCLSLGPLSILAQSQTAPSTAASANAASDYLKAYDLLALAKTKEDLSALEFIEKELPQLDAPALNDRKDIQAFIQKDAQAVQAMVEGARRPVCRFQISYDEGPDLQLPHLAKVRILCHRASAVAKLHQVSNDPISAGVIYGSLVTLATQLSQDQLIVSFVVGTSLLETVGQDVRRFLCGKPGHEAIEALSKAMPSISSPPYQMDKALQMEAQTFVQWCLRQPQGSAGFLKEAKAGHPEHFKRIDELSAPEESQVVEAWLGGYRERLMTLADLTAKPYWQSATDLRQFFQAVEQEGISLKANPNGGNPFVALLLPGYKRVAEVSAVAQAHLDMCRLAIALAQEESATSAYPQSLDALAPLLPEGMPKDPFTGKRYEYILEPLGPTLRCQPPTAIASGDPQRFTWRFTCGAKGPQ